MQSLIDRFRSGLDELGATIVTPADRCQRGAMLAVASTDENALVAALDAMNIGASCRDGNLRLSLHLYNSDEDVDTCLAALTSIDPCCANPSTGAGGIGRSTPVVPCK